MSTRAEEAYATIKSHIINGRSNEGIFDLIKGSYLDIPEGLLTAMIKTARLHIMETGK